MSKKFSAGKCCKSAFASVSNVHLKSFLVTEFNCDFDRQIFLKKNCAFEPRFDEI